MWRVCWICIRKRLKKRISCTRKQENLLIPPIRLSKIPVTLMIPTLILMWLMMGGSLLMRQMINKIKSHSTSYYGRRIILRKSRDRRWRRRSRRWLKKPNYCKNKQINSNRNKLILNSTKNKEFYPIPLFLSLLRILLS
jgi:hypothetical protein